MTVRRVRWLVVHDLHDAAGVWLGNRLRACLPADAADAMLVLPAPALTLHARFDLRIAGGRTESTVRLRLPGRPEQTVESTSVAGVLWRAHAVWMPATGRLPTAEASYQAMERHALLLAWLHGLGAACANRPRADSLNGPAWSPATWCAKAAACGLPVAVGPGAGLQAAPALFVVDDCVRWQAGCGDATDRAAPAVALQQAALRLARSEGCTCLALYGAGDARGRWRFTAADPCPDLRRAGGADEVLIPALARRLGLHAPARRPPQRADARALPTGAPAVPA